MYNFSMYTIKLLRSNIKFIPHTTAAGKALTGGTGSGPVGGPGSREVLGWQEVGARQEGGC